MCGIVGMLIKNAAMRDQLGELMTPMLVQMGTRGPESAGLAVFRGELPEGERKYSLHAPVWDYDWTGFEAEFIGRFGTTASNNGMGGPMTVRGNPPVPPGDEAATWSSAGSRSASRNCMCCPLAVPSTSSR